MYRIEYDIETGLVHNLSIVEDENYPETLVDGVAYYEGDIPEDVEGYEKVLCYKLVNTQENPEGISTFAVWEGNLYAEYKPIEGWMELADAKDVADLFIQSQKPKGLKFKAADNSVFAKTMKDLVLGTDDFTICVIARAEGSTAVEYPLLGFSKSHYVKSSFKLYGYTASYGSNGIDSLQIQNTESVVNQNLRITKIDNTTNLHHIVVSRSGVLIKCIVNGRLIKSATQDRVLDFSNFIYDVANTSYFYGGSVYNYAMTEAEALALWNGGRYDEVRLGAEWRKPLLKETPDINSFDTNQCGKETFSNSGITGVKFIATTQTGYVGSNNLLTTATLGDYVKIKFKLFMNDENSFNASSSSAAFGGLYVYGVSSDIKIDKTKVQQWQDVEIKGKLTSNTSRIYANVKTVGNWYSIADLEIIRLTALLEYKPENIRVDRMINTGAAGSAYDLIYSLPTKPTIIYEAPYKDKIVLEDKTTPDFHPIAVGQRCYTSDGKILESKLPAKGSEWQVSDWKLQ